MKTISDSLSHQESMFDCREPSPPFISLQQKTIATIRDSSFSYLNNQVDDSEISIFDAQKYFNESGSSDPRVSNCVSPVNVIKLERISEQCDFSAIPRFSSASSSVDGHDRNYRTRSFHATPTASSEASWNSQTGLLSNPPGAIAVTVRNPTADEKKRGSATKWLLGRKCPCSGKKSVQVEEKLSEPRTPSRLNHKSKESRNIHRRILDSAATDHWLKRREVIPSCHRISADNNHFPSVLGHHSVLSSSTRTFTDCTSGFSFPILNQTSPMKLVLNGLSSPNNYTSPPPPLEDQPRDSLEVFRPPENPVSTKTKMEFHRRQNFTFPSSPKSRMTTTDDDMASDASSDLFEIESLSTQTTSYPNHRRDSLEEARRLGCRINEGGLYCRGSLDEPTTPSVAPTECYEPSEASIDWSVTTAEGFDRASVTNFSITASEVEDMHRHESDKGSGGKMRGGLLSCRCEKAVSVGPQPVKSAASEGQRGGSSTLRHVSSRPPVPNKPPLARSHSARLSPPFAT
ncbi:hypothetical protein P3X46_000690 [Hevea brasiliensis]|uniref:Phytochrome kinase substrate 1 n=1 Tax=Hevea brasiliensis TaxID=3981 RepID=A0ABQ9NAU7_HEVBR|nr:protein PHYTOCHROME KINASE SUBSTRATE 4 [Hevea brasiliensis]KAJ9189386.1 hypothetical protein P3X46_000690 [Hevea brasiliensis]